MLRELRSREQSDYDRMKQFHVSQKQSHSEGPDIEIRKFKPMYSPRGQGIQLPLRMVNLMHRPKPARLMQTAVQPIQDEVIRDEEKRNTNPGRQVAEHAKAQKRSVIGHEPSQAKRERDSD